MNSFESLCKLASAEKWCWKIACTTCGHLHFRYSFKELSKGKSPDDSNWQIHIGQTSYPDLGSIPRDFTKEESRVLLEQCSTADLMAIKKDCVFPDWLGYLGLVINDIRFDGDQRRELSMAWAIQLLKCVRPKSRAAYRLQEIIQNESGILYVQDLELCETNWQSRA